MARRVPIRDVILPRHLSVGGGLSTTVPTQGGELETFAARMEVYTGWVGVGFQVGGGSTSREEASTFLPVGQNKVKSYAEGSLLDVTVTASPAVFADVEDEAAVVGIDGAPAVRLEPQTFPGVGGDQFCLVLRVALAALNATLHTFTYQVTVLTQERSEFAELQLEPGARPA